VKAEYTGAQVKQLKFGEINFREQSDENEEQVQSEIKKK
jgi:hypothetical protein